MNLQEEADKVWLKVKNAKDFDSFHALLLNYCIAAYRGGYKYRQSAIYAKDITSYEMGFEQAMTEILNILNLKEEVTQKEDL